VLIGVVHVSALPGTPGARESLDAIVRRAVEEARIYERAGFHGVILENMHDRPYEKGAAAPEIVAAMTAIAVAVRGTVSVPLGIQVLAAANREAVAVAHAAGAAFARVEGFVFGHVADEGYIDGCAGPLLRYRRAIGADRVAILADIKKKHAAHAVTADVDLVETAHAAEFFLADGLVVTGVATGREANPAEVEAVAAAVHVPVLVGSGITATNVHRYRSAHGFIVGSSVKRNGHWAGPLDAERAGAMREAFEKFPS
jgi:membrane complex biogenesis BtpA family protein